MFPTPSARRWLLLAALLFACPSLISAAEPPRRAVNFSRDILPILSDKCFLCHGPDAKHRQADLRLDEESAAKHTKDGVAAIVPGKSAESSAWQRIISQDADEVMPPPDSNRSLSAEQKALFKEWIDQGAGWGQHWAFEKLSRPTPPKLEGPAAAHAPRVKNPIDQFVFARLAREGIAPAPEADRTTLLRRVTLDLTGLPPTPEEVDALLADTSADAYEKAVDRLLASPAFGERMAWDWLEAARYADSNGYQGDGERTMWPWRDWVIDAVNQNLPYDQFTVWQLAGDLLPGTTREQKLATGFCRNHPINGEGGRIAEENRIEYIFDQTETMATVWLGLTFNCCRCHDHKFDPLSKNDYYSLFAYFNQTPVNGGGGNPQTAPILESPTVEQTARLKQLDIEIAAARDGLAPLEEPFKKAPEPAKVEPAKGEAKEEKKPEKKDEPQTEKPAEKPTDKPAPPPIPEKIQKLLDVAPAKRNPQQLKELEDHFRPTQVPYADALKKLRDLLGQKDGVAKSIVRVMVMEDLPQPRKTFVLDKGLYNQTREEITPRTPEKFPPPPKDSPKNRLGLAQWLVAADNPLTARITVNRFWQTFFGRGLVKSADDFGVQSEFPLHVELVDWLAVEFRDSGWDVKRLCRLIVTSSVYRQSSKLEPGIQERDPENRFLARGARYRMPAWMIRDQALAASGLLVAKVGGPPVKPYQPAGVWEEATFGNKVYKRDQGESLYRRSLYTFWRRIVGPTMFFDTPSRSVCSVKPMRTNTPLHALATLNDVTYVEAARALAQRVLLAGGSPEERVERAFRLVLARLPQPSEKQVLLSSVERLRKQYSERPEAVQKLLAVGESHRRAEIDPVEHAVYTGLCLAILNLDEALTKE